MDLHLSNLVAEEEMGYMSEDVKLPTEKIQSTEPKQVHADHLHEIGAENEGYRSDSPDQMSVFDGSGKEAIVVVGPEKEGTGKTAAEAAEDARNLKEPIGEGFYPPPK